MGSQPNKHENYPVLDVSTMDPVLLVFFCYYNRKIITSTYSCAGVDTSTLPKKRLRWHWHVNAFFGLKTVVNQKSVNLGMISARHTTNRHSFQKVTCPFNKIRITSWQQKAHKKVKGFFKSYQSEFHQIKNLDFCAHLVISDPST